MNIQSGTMTQMMNWRSMNMNNPWSDIATPTKDFNVRLVSEKHLLKLYWGKDVRGGYLFVIQFSKDITPDKKMLPELSGIRVAVAPASDCCRMVLLLNATSNWEIFKSLCVDLIYASENASTHSEAVNIIIRRLLRWHEFLKREKLHLLSPEAIKGLIGELLFMKNVLAPQFGWAESISFWNGPLGAPQDFAVYDTAVEVKAQSGSSKPYIQISSLEQMEAQLPDFYLVVNTLATIEPEHDEAFTLNSLISDIRKELCSIDDMTRELFESLVFQVGYIQLEQYDSPSFRCIASKSFFVDEHFPRLMVTNVPSGITKASYQISLDSCMPFEKELTFLNGGEDNDN